MAAEDCLNAIRAAAGDISDDEILEIAEVIQRRRKALAAEGRIAGIDAAVAEAAAEEGKKARLAAAIARKHAALNAVVRDRLQRQVEGLVSGGMSHRDAVRAVLIGSTKGLGSARVSVAAKRLAYEGRYLGEMFAVIERDRPHIRRMLDDPKLWDDTLRELYELRDGGTPGSTRNDDARYLADLFTRFSERSRKDLNGLGATIGRLAGWAPQVHDAFALRKVTAEAWVEAILPKLDIERTFPDLAGDEDAVRAVLADIHTTISTGMGNLPTAREKGEFVGPANLARRLSKHRVLHFRTANDWLAYSRQYGHGNVFTAMIGHQRQAARVAAQMDGLGPNPQAMLGALVESLKRSVRNDGKLTAEAKAKAMGQLSIEPGSSLGIALSEVRGLTSIPVSGRMAEIGSGIRAVQSMAKLGGAVLSAVFGDVAISAANLRFQGRPLFAAYGDTLREALKGRGKGEAAEIAFLIGEGFDGAIGHIISAYEAEDGPPGWISRRMVDFFKWSGLSGQADVMRAAAARALAAHAGRHASKTFARLDPRFAHVLSLHGIDDARWEAVRQTAWTGENGVVYLTPDRVAGLADDVVEGLIEGELAEARVQASLRGRPKGSAPRAELTEAQQAWLDSWKARRIERARHDLEVDLRGYFSDEVSFSHIETDEASRAATLQGTRPGTIVGEALRLVMQFKGFPIAFAQRILGRAVHGGEKGASAGLIHIGHLVVGLTIAGYMSMTAKDLAKGYEPRQPETPMQWAKVIMAAAAQGGGAGIYGDFLFGSANRFGGGVAGTLVGPAIGSGAQAIQLWQELRNGDGRAADWFNLALANVPGANLFWLRPALDGLVLAALHESMSPGYLARQAQRRQDEYGQDRLWPADWGVMP